MSINVCQQIDCPYFSPSVEKSYGCQMYTSAQLCHLRFYGGVKERFQLDPRITSASEYNLSSRLLSEYDRLSLKSKNEVILRQSPLYQNDVINQSEVGKEEAWLPFRILN